MYSCGDPKDTRGFLPLNRWAIALEFANVVLRATRTRKGQESFNCIYYVALGSLVEADKSAANTLPCLLIKRNYQYMQRISNGITRRFTLNIMPCN